VNFVWFEKVIEHYKATVKYNAKLPKIYRISYVFSHGYGKELSQDWHKTAGWQQPSATFYFHTFVQTPVDPRRETVYLLAFFSS
jgi:hypothetical protein